MRKLVSDGFCESMGANPIVYKLTEKGKNFKIVIEGENNDYKLISGMLQSNQ